MQLRIYVLEVLQIELGGAVISGEIQSLSSLGELHDHYSLLNAHF